MNTIKTLGTLALISLTVACADSTYDIEEEQLNIEVNQLDETLLKGRIKGFKNDSPTSNNEL